ncbi:MAG: DUF2339 domain-containing protein [Gemmatimonadetes bacterium]|nr:DUF2339 domain-containing protein [Gemmatimonadota bacterium]MBK7785588.1 DUF2339 domain-containing protein [Gemmatimonadota bacterium]
MSDDDRLARLEQRLAVLEGLVRQLVTANQGVRPVPSPPPVPPPAPPLPPPPPPIRPFEEAPSRRPPEPSRPRPSIISEEWLGQRGLLAVGVIFVILAAGYLLKLSFERGWISPLARCVGGALAGGAVSVLGWRLHGKGTRSYGAALIGLGAAIIYLAVWAAARLYQFLPPTPAIGALAAVSLALAGIAWVINLQALATTAALGAFFAPIVVGSESGSINLLLLYLGSMGAALGWVAQARRWRLTMAVVALAYFTVAVPVTFNRADAAGVYLYGILGGAAGLFVGLREGWFETRFLAFSGGWALLGIADHRATDHWPTLLGALVLTAPVWWRALRARTVWPDPGAFGDTFYFYLSPLLVAGALHQVAPEWLDATPGLLPLLVALPYLVVGLIPGVRCFSTVAAVALGIAALVRWEDQLPEAWALLALTLLWAGLDRVRDRRDGRWYALASYGVALGALLGPLSTARPETEAAFIGGWAVALWSAVLTAAALAAGLLRETTPPEGWGRGLSLRPWLWGVAGVLLLFGVTGELTRAFDLSSLDTATANLAGGLAVSAWWILGAAICFLLGFRRQIKPLRLAGFFVAGLALLKVVFVDLSELDALYRVGSAFILGVASLGVAYAYHRGAERR